MKKGLKKIAKLALLSFFITVLPFGNYAYASFAQSTDLEAGSNQYWKTTTQVTLSGQNISMSAWYNPESVPSGTSHWIFMKEPDNQATRDFEMVVTDSGSGVYKVLCQIRNTGTVQAESWATVSISNGTWTWLACTFDGTQAAASRWNFYQDSSTPLSKTDLTSLATSLSDSNVPFRVGANGAGNGPLDGKVSHARLHQATHSGADLYTDRCNDSNTLASLEGEWKFDGDANDTSGNGYNLTAINGAGFVADGPVCLVATPNFTTNFELTE